MGVKWVTRKGSLLVAKFLICSPHVLHKSFVIKATFSAAQQILTDRTNAAAEILVFKFLWAPVNTFAGHKGFGKCVWGGLL